MTNPHPAHRHSRSVPKRHRPRLTIEVLEAREVPANNLTVVAGPSVNIDIQNPGNSPTSTIRTTGADAQLGLATLAAELQKPHVRTVIVTTEAKNSPSDGKQLGNIEWDSAAGGLDYAGFGTGKTLVFRTVDDPGAEGDITLRGVQFSNGPTDNQIGLTFDTTAAGGDVAFRADGGGKVVFFSDEAVADLTVSAGTGAFAFDDGTVINASGAAGAVGITAGAVTIAMSGGLTARRDITVSGTAVELAGTGLLSDDGRVTVTGTTGITLTNTAVDAEGAITLTGGSISLTDSDLLSEAGDITLTGTAVALSGSSADTQGGALSVTGTAITFGDAGLGGFTGVTVAGPVTLAVGGAEVASGGAAGSVRFTGAVDGAFDLEVAAGRTISFAADVGSADGLTGFAVRNGLVDLGPRNLTAAVVTIGDDAGGVSQAGLAGSGTVTGDVTVKSDGYLAPGGDRLFGTLTVEGDVSFAGADLALDLGTTTDKLHVNGDVSVTGSSRLGGGRGIGALPAGAVTVLTYTGSLTGQFENAAVGMPALVGADAVTVTAYNPAVTISPLAAVGKVVTGFDPADTTLFKAVLAGPGSLVTGTDWMNQTFLVARGTTTASRLTITTTANGSDDIVSFDAGVLIDGALAALSAPKVDIGTQLRSSGVLLSVVFRDFQDRNGAGVDLGGTPAQRTAITARNLPEDVSVGAGISIVRVARGLGNFFFDPDLGDFRLKTLTAPSIGTLQAGQMSLDVTTPGPVAAVRTTGQFAGTVTAKSIGTFTAGNATDAALRATGAITAVKTTGEFDGTVAAGSLGRFEAGGGTAALEVAGAIGSVIGKGETALTLAVSAGQLGTVTVAGELSGDEDETTTDWAVTGGIARLTAGAIYALDVSARSLGPVLVAGNTAFGLSGYVEESTFTLTGADAYGFGLKSLVARGNVSWSTFDVRGGNVGAVTVGRFLDSRLYLGYTADPSGDFNLGSFGPGKFRLASFRTTAVPTTNPDHPLQWAFRGSEVVADAIGTVTLSGLNTDNGAVAFGIKVRSAGTLLTVAKADTDFPAGQLGIPLSPDRMADDFRFIRV